LILDSLRDNIGTTNYQEDRRYMLEVLVKEYGPFMDLADLAELLKIKKQSLYQQIYRDGLDIPHVKRGKKYLFPTEEVAIYFTSQLSLPPSN